MIVSKLFFCNSLTRNGEISTPANDRAPPAGLVEDYIALVAYPAPLVSFGLFGGHYERTETRELVSFF